ncbi:hypothetical protein COCCADRAFT_89176 [Bipolaris zeicola 26-R-13]|uniref:Uncharacterized protein n=1 Tax=Cochliobolus carbonum (strain 26-R-13) TaxID=930089 RepID=W6YEF8_COCC2|nr:uncharacterized protein COCCADRAFT_89176 [Bipolaris zeicola 26-R-13]EUC36048.1 hypothetical protein COCCADRAFT_89176 [Bipolaris zeicola 26-R-13]
MAFPVDYMPKVPRYYATALSKEDKHILIHGEENHNLKQWTGWDLVRHHESRRSLIPQVMPKVEKMNALADIEHGKQYSQRAIPKAKVKDKVLDKVRGLFHVPRIKITTDKGKEYQESTCTQSTHGQRSTSSSPSRSLSTPSLALDNNATEHSSPRHPRPSSSSSDYFSHRPTHRTSSSSYHRRISPLALSPGHPSDSSRVRSPLSHQVSFQPNPDITFDTFLAPHESGKGEVLHEVADAKKSGAAKRLSKMPSMPLLRKRDGD